MAAILAGKMPVPLRQVVRRHADGDDRTGLNYIQTVLLGGCDQFVALAAGVEPQLRWFASGNFGQRFQANCRREIDAYSVELHVSRNPSERSKRRQSFDLAPFW